MLDVGMVNDMMTSLAVTAHAFVAVETVRGRSSAQHRESDA